MLQVASLQRSATPEGPQGNGRVVQADGQTVDKSQAKGTLITLDVEVPFFNTSPGQSLVLIGSLPEMGGWELASAVQMEWNDGHRWTASVPVPRASLAGAEFKVRPSRRGYGLHIMVIRSPLG